MSENTGLPLNQENLDRAAKAAAAFAVAYRKALADAFAAAGRGLTAMAEALERSRQP